MREEIDTINYSYNEFYESSFFPGKWYVELWRKPIDGPRYFLRRDTFEVKDNFTYLKIIYPEQGDTVIGREVINLYVLENHWGNVAVEVSSITGKKSAWDTTFHVSHKKKGASFFVPFDFGANEGERFRISATITDYSGNTMSQSVEVVVGRPVLTIELQFPEVMPYYPARIPVAQSRTNVIVRATRPGSNLPVRNYPIRVFARRVEYSGGHDHPNNAQGGPFGEFTQREGFTNEDGIFTTTYTASAFGGEERIFACANVASPSDTVSSDLIVRVPGLFLFPTGGHWLKVGGTCLHYGPPKPWNPNPPECQQPDNNHWINQNAYENLVAVAEGYYFYTGHILCINDISLPYGGLFDIDGNWAPPHRTHRLGEDIDIAIRVVNEQGQVVGMVNRRVLEERVLNLEGYFRVESNCYHITFRR